MLHQQQMMMRIKISWEKRQRTTRRQPRKGKLQRPLQRRKKAGKSSVLLDVKPWDDETDMKKLEEVVRSVQMPGLLWGASKLVLVGYGIKKL
ncbi:hypothetical protein H6P81_016394 [Aristolochia fimbriata]|uniref:Translation elongation factor EF1B beta/delta subunit guanine nucleotide exchange domain-containing protein n=1 Tax=Aristolochia fimbriata TaxID=158543 RepID=A0AAV7E8L1_ARIFI|nr:hypothetical protein H6P81_016394 [Aristolochia fimbriata]